MISDVYYDSQKTHNLLTSNRLNEKGEWAVKMVINCRIEYFGSHYRYQFEPGNGNRRPEKKSLFQEAVVSLHHSRPVRSRNTSNNLSHCIGYRSHAWVDGLGQKPILADNVVGSVVTYNGSRGTSPSCSHHQSSVVTTGLSSNGWSVARSESER